MTALLVFIGIVLLVIGLLLRRISGPPVGNKLVYADTNKCVITSPITSHKSRLTGKPDYVYQFKSLSVPVEVKNHRAGRFGPGASDIAQLMAYGVLLEDNGDAVAHGLIEYPDKRITISYTPEARKKVLEAAETIRAERRAGTAERSHNEAWKCRSCGVRESCDQRLI